MDYQFPEGFLWGGASSGPQSEGGSTEGDRVMSEWDYWFSKEPERFYRQVGPSVTSDFYHKYPEYIEKMKAAGVKSYRTSIQWSRVIRDCDGTVNEDGIQFYNQVIDELIRNGIEPMMCLHHFDLPLYWVEKGGFENRETAYAFARFAAVCFGRFGDRVKYWTTFNEPVIIPETGYLYQRHYPAVCDAGKAAAWISCSCQQSAWRVQGGCDGKIGIIINLTPTYCENPEKAEDRRAAEILDLIFNRSFLDPSVKGEYPVELKELLEAEGILPEVSEGDREMIRENTVDYLGVNYYHPRRAKARTTVYEGPLMPEKYYEPYEFEGQKMNTSRGWEIYEPAIYDIAMNLKENYGNIPWYISENGMGIQDEEQFMGADGMVEDDYRIEFIKEHLTYLHKAIEEGCNCFGYHLWSPFDCWSWTNAYKNRYGLLRVDIYDGCKITMKKSAHWFRKLSENNGF
ncbi:MAG: glycoside hydrolase family 1 protein [Hungatella hathewayi]